MFASPEPDSPTWWYPSSGNHVLHSILARIFTSLFGLSHLTLRAAAILGAAVFIGSVYGLCRSLLHEPVIRRPLFVCLVFNPFIMDYMVAARGYSLALGCLTAALLVMARGSTQPAWIASSALIGLSLTANFSFGYADAAAVAALTLWACGRSRSLRTATACVAPACLVTLLICGHTILNFPRSQLYYGASGLKEMWHSVVTASFDDLNPYIVNPLLAGLLTQAAHWVPRLFIVLGILQLGAMAFRKKVGFAALLAGTGAAALGMHWLAFRVARIPLPLARTAIFFVPLSVLFLALAAVAATSRFERALRICTIGMFQIAAVYFIGCLRLSYFKEWQFDIDVREAFGVLREIHRKEGISEIPSDWRYSSTLNFYRRFYGEESLAPFTWETHKKGDRPAYVAYLPDDRSFIDTRRLQIVYKAKHSDLVIAMKPVAEK